MGTCYLAHLYGEGFPVGESYGGNAFRCVSVVAGKRQVDGVFTTRLGIGGHWKALIQLVQMLNLATDHH